MFTNIHVWTCDFCGATVTRTGQVELIPGNHILHPGYLPSSSWHWIEDKLACPRHEVIVKDKAE